MMNGPARPAGAHKCLPEFSIVGLVPTATTGDMHSVNKANFAVITC
jgi:hypothetical protein